MVSIAEAKSVVEEEEYAAPTVEPTSLPSKAVVQDSPEKIFSQ